MQMSEGQTVTFAWPLPGTGSVLCPIKPFSSMHCAEFHFLVTTAVTLHRTAAEAQRAWAGFAKQHDALAFADACNAAAAEGQVPPMGLVHTM